jgi:adenylate kinase
MRLVLVGPPGAGKGTQAQFVAAHLSILQISTGDIFRANVSQGTPLGKQAKEYMDAGGLVPDDVIIGVILEAIATDEAANGFLLDGFPRTVPQADALGAALQKAGRKISAVLLIDVPDDEVVRRLSGRRVSRSGRVYHVDFDPPKHPDRCDIDGSALIQRDDDKPETIRKRLAVYHEQTEPLVDYYESRDLLRRFDGTRTPTEVHDHVRATVATLRLEDEL